MVDTHDAEIDRLNRSLRGLATRNKALLALIAGLVVHLVIGLAIVLGIAFYQHGEVLFWHKQLVFWGTVALVVFFMFKSSPK